MDPVKGRPKLVFYKDGESVPAFQFLVDLKRSNVKAFVNGLARLALLEEEGHRLDRPASGFLGDGIHELRWKQQTIQFRLLYFFHKQECIVLSHGIQKEGSAMDKEDIKRAKERRSRFEKNPKAHSFEFTIQI